jgi:uncharacterized membrane protein YbhN (UPF0104 family)
MARLLVIASVLDALAVPHPVSTAVIASCGLALGNSLPVAPGGAGVAAAAMAVALGQTGLHASTAVAAAVAFHTFETAAGLAFGISGWLALGLVPSTGSRMRGLAAEPALAAPIP